jgi:hypothetical protein
MNKENLPAESGIPISGREIIATIMGQFWDIKVPTPTTSPQSTPNLQLNVKPGDTEESNQITGLKTPSVSQTSLGAMQTLEIATVTTRFQELSRDIRVPVVISWRMYKIDKIICKFESNRAVGSLLGNL